MNDWTSTTPTEEGWYWHTSDLNGLKSQDYEVLYVYTEKNKLGVLIKGYWEEFVPLEFFGGLWHPKRLEIPPMNGEK